MCSSRRPNEVDGFGALGPRRAVLVGQLAVERSDATQIDVVRVPLIDIPACAEREADAALVDVFTRRPPSKASRSRSCNATNASRIGLFAGSASTSPRSTRTPCSSSSTRARRTPCPVASSRLSRLRENSDVST